MWGPDRYSENAHGPVFGKEDRITVPYDDSNDEKITSYNSHYVPEMRGVTGHVPHRMILNHLKSNNYYVDDYASGLTYHEDSPTRKIKIMAALKKIGSDTNPSGVFTTAKNKPSRELTMGQLYETDPVRAAITKEKHIVITKNKYDVAGMSTNRGWSSCMNLVDGSNRHYVKHDIQHGTLTAYVCTKDDKNISHPIGRINLKQFMHVGSNHAIYRPENSRYGTIPTKFPQIVNDWAEKHYPPKDAGIYAKQSNLYNDDGVDIKTHRLDELDPEKELHQTTENLLDHKLRGWSDRFNKPDDYPDPMPFVVESTLDEHHRNLSGRQEAHSIVHWVADHSYENNGDTPKEVNDLDYDDVRSTTPLHAWACENTNKFKHNVGEFTPADSMIALDKIHHAIKGSEDEDHEQLKSIHWDLIDHVFHDKHQHEPAWDHVKSHIIEHLTDDKHVDYYFAHRHNTVSDESGKLHGYSLATLSKNPRHIHNILNLENDHLEENSLDHTHGIQHIGENADLKLAHHIYMENDNMPDHYFGQFTRALDDNPKGEHIQHELLNQMHLDVPDEEYSERHAAMVNSIAKHTTHKSVVDRIKARTNSDLSFAKNAIKSNSLYTHSPIMEAYLRFLK